MHVLIECNGVLPALRYDGTERVVWWLGKALVQLGHKVTYLVKAGSTCPFADVIHIDPELSVDEQIPADVDIVHLQGSTLTESSTPFVSTIHGNVPAGYSAHPNTIFISRNQAERCGGSFYIHHGLDLAEYGDPALATPRRNLVFLAKAAWRIKNVKGAIKICNAANAEIEVAGGNRLNFKMGFRFTTSPKAHFHGMVDQTTKLNLLRRTEGLIFPVLWHEPFGLALIEAMYFGNPVFATSWGSIPELVPSEIGFHSNSEAELVTAIKNRGQFDKRRIHEYVCELFDSKRMAQKHVAAYEHVLNGGSLHPEAPVKPIPKTPEPRRFNMLP